MNKKKKASLPIIALLITLIIIGSTALFSYNNITRQKAYEKKLAETIITTIKYYDNIDDVIINTEKNPKQVTIITNYLTPEAKEHIEKLINDVYPESTVNYSSD